MMELAGSLGREKAHELVYDAARTARREGMPLHDALQKALSRERSAQLARIAPLDYVGDAPRTVEAACRAWRDTRQEEPADG
jgi:3-carboxy-cis,cis-muconate cycloisomerase